MIDEFAGLPAPDVPPSKWVGFGDAEMGSEILKWGNPWHGRLQAGKITTSGGQEITGITSLSDVQLAPIGPARPDTQLVAFEDLQDPETSDEEAELGMEWRKTAILFDGDRRYSPFSRFALGRNCHIYRAADGTRYLIKVTVSLSETQVWAIGANATVPVSVTARECAPDAEEVTILQTSVTATALWAPYLAHLINIAPKGDRCAIVLMSCELTSIGNDARRSAGAAGIWEITLSGGENAPPVAVLAEVKSSDDCWIHSTQSGPNVLCDILQTGEHYPQPYTYGQFGAGISPLNPGDLLFVGSYYVWIVGLYAPAWTRTDTTIIWGAAYDRNGTLRILGSRAHSETTSTFNYTGPAPRGMYAPIDSVQVDYILRNDGTFEWQAPVPRTIDFTASGTVSRSWTFALTVDGAEVKTWGATVEGSISREHHWHADPAYASQASSAAYLGLFDGQRYFESGPSGTIYADPLIGGDQDGPGVYFRAGSNNAVGLVSAVAIQGVVTPAGLTEWEYPYRGRVSTSDGSPWLCWNPLTDELTTQPVTSWV